MRAEKHDASIRRLGRETAPDLTDIRLVLGHQGAQYLLVTTDERPGLRARPRRASSAALATMARMPRDYRRNHIASASYLTNFADTSGELCAIATDNGSVTRGRPQTMGFRNDFWGGDRMVRTFAERQLSIFENDASHASEQLLSSGVPRPNTDDRLALMMLIAIHITRNPAGRENLLRIQQHVLSQNAAKYREDLSSEQYDELLRRLTSDAFITDVFLRNLSKVASFLGSMHWTLVEFNHALLATSDQPVTIVPLMRPGVDVPVAAIPSGPLVDCLEVRFALTPCHALVMAWIDEPDDGPS
jgi:Protein of unknown function (DUF4238)